MDICSWNSLKGSGILLVWSICMVQGVHSVEIDLIEDLSHLPSEYITRSSAVWSLNLTGYNHRNYILSLNTTEGILNILSKNRGFSLCVAMTQDISNSGTIFSIMYQEKLRFLEIKVSLKRKVIKILYFPNWEIYGFRTEKLPFNSTFSDTQPLCIDYDSLTKELSLRIECIKVASVKIQESIPFINYKNYNKNQFKIWVGQRAEKKGLFKGTLKKMIFSDDSEFSSRYCSASLSPPDAIASASNVQVDFSDRLSSLENELKDLKKQLAETQKYMGDVKQCQCFPQCVAANGKTKSFGETWLDTPCSNCTCTLSGKICQEQKCPELSCNLTMTDEGRCCPRCAYNCQYKKKKYPHNQGFSIGCMDCHCNDGSLSCRRINPEVQCPKLKCQKFLQVKQKGQCCKKCVNLCELSKCAPMASCVDFGCQCNRGYEGNPYKSCVDIDECRDPLICPANSICMNSNGSFVCKCKQGFTFNESLDFCKATCSKNPCHNNSTCVGPDRCECKSGFTGPSCDMDIDECKLDLIRCPMNSQCINTPGGYVCQCISGYHSIRNDTLSVSFDNQCEDINECFGSRGLQYHCESASSCENIPGGYRCVPKADESQIFGSNCAIQYQNGEITMVYDKKEHNFLENCKVCQCQSGILNCQGLRCDCSLDNYQGCCPNCSRGTCEENSKLLATDVTALHCKLVYAGCHNARCPRVTCSESVLVPGQCCKSCRSDPLTSCIMVYNNFHSFDRGLIDFMPKCNSGNTEHKSGETFILRKFPDGSCTRCLCWNRHFCCGKSFSCS